MNAKYYLLGLLAGALSFSSCSKDNTFNEPTIPGEEEFGLTFEAIAPELPMQANGTRTSYIPGTGIQFNDKEDLGTYGYFQKDANAPKEEAANSKGSTWRVEGAKSYVKVRSKWCGAGTYTFTFASGLRTKKNTGITDNNEFSSVSQFNTHINKTLDQLSIHLTPEQTPSAESFDPFQDIVIGEATQVEMTANKPSEGSGEAPIRFKRMFTFFRLNLAQTDMAGLGSQVNWVQIKSTGATLTGDANVPVTNDFAACVPTFTQTYDYAKATFKTPVSINADAQVWFVVNPTTLPNGIEITIDTDTKIIKQTINSGALDFKANMINTLDFKNANTATVKTTIIDKDTNHKGYFEEGITIDNTPYKNGTPGAKLISQGIIAPSSQQAVFFIQDKASVEKSSTMVADLVFIGNNKDTKSRLTFNNDAYFNFNGTPKKLIFKNLVIDFTNANPNYILIPKDGSVHTIYFEDCEIIMKAGQKLYTLEGKNSDLCTENFTFRNCEISTESNATYHFIDLKREGKTTFTDLNNLQSINFENCKIYSRNVLLDEVDKNTRFALFSISNNKVTNVKAPNLKITFNNNTIIDYGFYYYGIFKLTSEIKSFDATKNIFYTNPTDRSLSIIGYNGATQINGTINCEDNKIYGGKLWYRTGTDYEKDKTDKEEHKLALPKETNNPLTITNQTTGNFISNIPGYGSTLK